MSASLVGSEMCIRDRCLLGSCCWGSGGRPKKRANPWSRGPTATEPPVSYTHLTLPTICSV
eukprot:4769357-Alexandrium_andersonii.AAC.1